MRAHALVVLAFCLTAGPAEAAIMEIKEALHDGYGLEVAGFLEAAGGRRIQHDAYEEEASLAEVRLQLDLSRYLTWGTFTAKGDLLADGVTDEVASDVRELNVVLSPLADLDLKVGRQTVTWGTADLLFINDVFPKDWESYFIGRDDEFLKGASDAARASLFFAAVNIDAVYIPVATASRHITGERLSYWNPLLNRTAGQDYRFPVDERSSFGNDSEYAVRLYRTIGSLEFALYGYSGFWKTPEGMEPASLSLYYPQLGVYGSSLRGPLFDGIGHVEFGYYDSREDRGGSNPLVPNSDWRFLCGLERELGHELTGGLQYYLEWMTDYDAYERSVAAGSPLKDEYRHVVTLRLTKLLLQQNLILSFFAYYSPSDADGYLRPKVQYKVTDRWLLETGGNFFFGTEKHTFFGQFEDNSNIFARVRWSF